VTAPHVTRRPLDAPTQALLAAFAEARGTPIHQMTPFRACLPQPAERGCIGRIERRTHRRTGECCGDMRRQAPKPLVRQTDKSRAHPRRGSKIGARIGEIPEQRQNVLDFVGIEKAETFVDV